MKSILKTFVAGITAAAGSLTATAQTVRTFERGDLKLHIFISAPTIFTVASVVIETPSELALVDAQFSADNAGKLIELVRSLHKPLKQIYISHSDPDYYFGLDAIAQAFPEARIFATPQTAWLIGATSEEKMNIWAPQLAANAPERIRMPEAYAGDRFNVGGLEVQIQHYKDDRMHSWLWIPAGRVVLGGVYLFGGEHLWVADSQAAADRAAWRAALDQMAALQPQFTVAAHFLPDYASSQGDANLQFTRKYLVSLEEALRGSTTARQVIVKMRSLYPRLGGVSNLDMTAEVLKGEKPWRTVLPYPALGRKLTMDFGGDFAFALDFAADGSHMTYTGLRGSLKDKVEPVEYHAVEISRGVYMTYWTERDRTHVTHVENYNTNQVWSNIALPDKTFLNLHGTIEEMEP